MTTLEPFERLRNNKDLDRERRRRQNCKTTMPLQRYRETKIQQLMNLHYLFLDKIKYQLVMYKHFLDWYRTKLKDLLPEIKASLA